MLRVFPLVCAVVLAACALGSASATGTSTAANCQDYLGYSYGTFQTGGRVHGIAATIRELKPAVVLHGHIAGWVGFGEPHDGPHGADEWLQVGLNATDADNGVAGYLYYEVYAPGVSQHYHEIAAAVPVGEAHRVALLEVRGRPNHWRVWVDGRPVSPAIAMPHTGAGWISEVSGENWDGGVGGTCNGFSFAVDQVKTAAAPGGSWKTIGRGLTVNNAPYRIRQWAPGNFIAELDPARWPAPVAPAQPAPAQP